jgi:hypothetical protein
MRFGAADRDVELSRVSRLTRWMVAGAVGTAGVLSAVVAQALPGGSASSATSSGSTTQSVAATNPAAPTVTTPATGPSVTDPTTTPNLTPSPPPVSTPRRSVARSGAS